MVARFPRGEEGGWSKFSANNPRGNDVFSPNKWTRPWLLCQPAQGRPEPPCTTRLQTRFSRYRPISRQTHSMSQPDSTGAVFLAGTLLTRMPVWTTREPKKALFQWECLSMLNAASPAQGEPSRLRIRSPNQTSRPPHLEIPILWPTSSPKKSLPKSPRGKRTRFLMSSALSP